jgi:hypothetical protein
MMSRIHLSAQNPFNKIPPSAVAVYQNGLHVGLLHRQEDASSFQVLHLCDHKKLVNRAPSIEKFPIWIDPPLDETSLMTVAWWCRRIFELHGNDKMPYGFSDPNAFFDADGQMIPNTVGLTCATLVLAIFHQVGIPLLKYPWPQRQTDMEFWNRMKDHIAETNPEQAARMEKDGIRCRYHPREVAGAASVADKRPVPFEMALIIATEIKQMLEKR